MSNDLLNVRLILLNKPLFKRKLAVIVASMAVLVPLVMLKTKVPAIVYVTVLLLIHIAVFVVYLYRVQWREFSKVGLVTRLLSVLVFSYLLSKVRYSGGVEVLLSIGAAFALHLLILTVLMVKVEPRHPAAGA